MAQVIAGIVISGESCNTEADHDWTEWKTVHKREQSHRGKHAGAGYVQKQVERRVCARCGKIEEKGS